MGQSILIVEDEEKIARFIELELLHEGYEVEKSQDGRDGLGKAQSGRFDLMILDVMLPGLNGFEVLRRLRKDSSLPVIMLTARDAVMDKVAGLDGGADDYMTKPFSFNEMVMRVGAQLRRYYEFNSNKHQGTRHYGDFIVSSDRFEAKYKDEPISLTAKEFKILDYLTVNENQIIPKQKLIDEVWGIDEYIDENTVAVTIARLRDKLAKVGINNIVTVWGLGYKWQF